MGLSKLIIQLSITGIQAGEWRASMKLSISNQPSKSIIYNIQIQQLIRYTHAHKINNESTKILP